MGYKIETISVYEVFEQKGGCPFCRLEKRLENEYIEYYLGSAAMTPEIRIKVNRSGFCAKHLDGLYNAGNRLPLALELNTFMQSKGQRMKKAAAGFVSACAGREKRAAAALAELEQAAQGHNRDCLICASLADSMERYIDTSVHLYIDQARFRELYDGCGGFCTRHFSSLLKACLSLGAKDRQNFARKTCELQLSAADNLTRELEDFTKMFDYRSRGREWGSERTAVARTAAYLGGDTRPDTEKETDKA